MQREVRWRPRTILLCGGLSSGCLLGAEVKEPPDPRTEVDPDGDGFFGEDDCAPGNPLIHSGADEVCNGIDDNCDGLVDDLDPYLVGELRVWLDTDGDGFGAEGTDREACVVDSGWAVQAGDCSDADAARNPDADEVWYDGIDQDCDPTNECDQDEDGVPCADASCPGCPTTDVADCDDTTVTVRPGLLDVCGTGVDEDCSGLPDDRDEDLDGWVSVECGGEDCDDTDADTRPDAADRCGDGVDGDCDGSVSPVCQWGAGGATVALSDADRTVVQSARVGAQAGFALAAVGDQDGDGSADLLVAGPAGVPAERGVVWLVPGRAALHGTDLNDRSSMVRGADVGFGGAVTGVEDLNGDGLPDFAVGEDLADDSAGGVRLFFGGTPWPDGASSMEDFDPIWLGGFPAGARAGTSLSSPGDLDGDGLAELIVGAKLDSSVSFFGGGVWVFSGRRDWSAFTVAIDRAVWHAADATQYLGSAHTVGTGDLDGDGLAELVMGAPGATGSSGQARVGGVYVVDGNSFLPTGDYLASDADTFVSGGSQADLSFGSAVPAQLGDLDNDGYADLVVGAPGYDGGSGYEGMVVGLGGTPGWSEAWTGTSATDATWTWLGPTPGSGCGAALEAGDGSGGHRLAVGCPSGASSSVYLLADSDWTGALSSVGALHIHDDVGYGAGTDLVSTDQDGDGLQDLWIGAPGWGPEGSAAGHGSIWLILGSDTPGTGL